MKLTKKVIALLLATTLTIGSATIAMGADTPSATTAQEPTKVEDAFAADDSVVDTTTKGTATLVQVGDELSSKVTVDKVTVNGVEYTVTTIGAKAFEGAKATTVTLGAGIKKIDKSAFSKSKVKTLVLTGKKAITVKKGAFTKSKVKTIKVNKKMSKSQFKKLEKALKKAGFKGKIKKVTIK